MAKEVPIAEKSLLTPEEAAAYFNIGVNKIRMMTDNPNCPWMVNIFEHAIELLLRTQLHYLVFQSVFTCHG